MEIIKGGERLDRAWERTKQLGRAALSVLSPLPDHSERCLSEHIHHEPTDGEAIQPELPFGGMQDPRVLHYVEMAKQARRESSEG